MPRRRRIYPKYVDDRRLEYIFTIIETFFECDRAEEKVIMRSNELTDFLDDPICGILCLRRRPDVGMIIDRTVVFEEDDQVALVFHKMTPEPVTEENMRQRICFVNILESPVSTLHFNLSNVFKPTIHDSTFWSRRLDPELQHFMIELVHGLNALMLKKNSAFTKVKGVFTVDDEVCVWKQAEKTVRAGTESQKVTQVLGVLEEISRELHQCVDWASGIDIFDGILMSLQDMWRLGEELYPQDRLIHLLDLIGTQITFIVQNAIKNLKVWTESYNEVDNQLSWGILMCTKMNEISHKCTKTLWPNFDPTWRKYTLNDYVPLATTRYLNRLKDLLRIRSVHRQITALVTVTECKSLNPKDSFAPFKGINVLFSNSHTDQEFAPAVEAFEHSLVPAEAKLSVKLRAKLNSRMSNFQLMLEFKRYQELIQRPKIAHDIQSQREQLLLAFAKMIGSYSEKIESQEYVNLGGTHSQEVNEIYNLRQIYFKVKEIQAMGECTLNDLRDYDHFRIQAQFLATGIEELEKRVFQRWTNKVNENILEEGLALNNRTQVIDFNNETKFMEVNYSTKLHGLIEDVNQLTLLGFRLPPEVNVIVQKAARFVKQANELDQIASFHNTIGDRMIACQRPMMLDTAMVLSELVTSQKKVSWSSIENVQQYIANFQTVVHYLSRQNNKLSQLHKLVKQKVDLLFGIDIVSGMTAWKNSLDEIRNIFTEAEVHGYQGLKSWKHHWDLQIYKAFEIAYIKGLQVIDTKLPSIAVEIVFRQRKLQFKPGFQEVKATYYTLLRKFLSLPQYFIGLCNDPEDQELFSNISKMNGEVFQDIYRRSAVIIKRLEQSKDKFGDWVALGAVDLDVICEKFLKSGDDWDTNFKMCRNNVIEIARLQFGDEEIPPFKISSKILRSDIETMNRQLYDKLRETLITTIQSEIQHLERFLRDGIKNLGSVPVTPDDICVSQKIRERMIDANVNLCRIATSIDAKNMTLKKWIKMDVDTQRIHHLMATFKETLNRQTSLISNQVELIRSHLEHQNIILENNMSIFKSQWEALRDTNNEEISKLNEIVNFINERQTEWKEIKAAREQIIHTSNKLGIHVTIPNAIKEVEKEINLYEGIWQEIQNFNEELKRFQTEPWATFANSHYQFEEFLQRWKEKFLTVEENPLITNVLIEIQGYQNFVPNLKYLRGDCFAEKHWHELYSMIKMSPRPSTTLVFGDFLNLRLEIEAKFKEIKDLNRKATGEVTLRQAIEELDNWETEAQFVFTHHMDSQKKTIQIIHDFKTVLNKVGDNQSLLHSIKSSPFYNRFADQINAWEGKLTDLDFYLSSLSKIQRRWIYLEPVFSHGVLDNEQTRFKRIDKDFRVILGALVEENRVCALCRIQGIRALLSSMLDQLGRCQNSLNEFLELKRSGFPRFYFLGDDDLLEILGQSTKAAVIQSHLKKLFAGIYNVEFDEDYNYITAMKSIEGEVVVLKRKVRIRPNVEEWLSELAQEMKLTLKAYTFECLSERKNAKQDPDQYPSQILTLCNTIAFTGRCEESIRSNKLQTLLGQLKEELDSYTNVKIDSKHPNPKVLELKLKDMILDLIHQLDTVEFLISNKIMNVTDFAWQKQLRFYVKDDGDVSVRMADAEFAYSYEYQGNAPKLVHTPLTNKCYLTLTQGMRIGLGGNPFGPAGTGKTESVKALGAFLGRQVLVFNCDEGIDVKAMGRIFIGLVKCGAWGCFDEFNRLDGATLSAVSMQIQPIQSALKHNDKTVRLLDETVPIDPNTGIFVTLNPAGKGYGGRNELPDNLKQLFRPVAMTSPNIDLISEVILCTEGFHCSKKLAIKLVEVFNLSSGLLTPQKHYDWGLRALKTVLKGCGNTLQSFKERGLQASEEDEVDIVVSALRLNTLPKLTSLDASRFNNLIKDLFGNVVFKDLGHVDLEENVRASFPELKLHLNENQVRKCMQLFEQLEQRMGVVIVGPPCSGKSTICSILKHALTRMKSIVKTYTINPKALQKSQLLGHINVDTRQWSDGVLTLKAQEVYNETEDVRSWIICDGDIDPEWVESLNSVLDDNRMLTLPSGWRIKFGPNVNFLFETHDLSYASPATVSRMGMILTCDEDADVNGVINAWLEGQPMSTRSKTEQLIKEYFHKCLDWVTKFENNSLNLPLVSIVKNGLSHMSNVVNVSQMCIAMIRGLGCHIGMEHKEQFVKQVLSWTKFDIERNFLNLTYNSIRNRIEAFGDDDLIDLSKGVDVKIPPLVKTANVKQTLAQIEPWLQNSESFLFVGSEGSGKTMIIEYAFGEMRNVEIAKIYCSSLITPQHVLQKLSQVCISKSSGTGREYIAKNGGRLIIYLKDLNLVKPDKWGTCALVEFLLQILTYQGFYDSNLEFIGLKNVQIVASTTVGNSDGRHTLSPRFTSNIRYCTVMQPLKEELMTIYKTYLTLSFNSLHSNSQVGRSETEISKIVQAMIMLYEEVRKTFPRSKQSHYQFTSRDLTNWVFGMMRYDVETMEKDLDSGFVQIWINEACRLFRDRLVSADERSKFDEVLEGITRRIWSTKTIQPRGFHFISGYARIAAKTPVANTQIKVGQMSSLVKVSGNAFEEIVIKGMSQFARENRELNIVLFPEVLDDVAHFDRILSAPCSSLVLAGRAGIGRRSALFITSALHGAALYTLKVGQNYGVKHFKNDLKNAIRLSAIEGNKVFLIVEDFQLIDEVFLDMLNGLLSSGEVPSLYTPEELETVMSALRDSSDDEGYTSNLLSFFVKRIKELLHVILIMDYTNNSFQNNCERNPALYKQCSLLWLDSWSADSLLKIPKLIVSKFYATQIDTTPSTALALKKHDSVEVSEVYEYFRSIYTSLTQPMASPRRYIAFVHTYGLLYTKLQQTIVARCNQLKAGVRKLDEARDVVKNLQTQATTREVVLAAKKEETTFQWNLIMENMRTTQEQEINVKELQAKTVAENKTMLQKKTIIDAELKEIHPRLIEAQEAVGNLNEAALNEIKTLRAPPATITNILEGVLCLMGIKDHTWMSMKTFLSRRTVIKELKSFDSAKINPADRRAVEALLVSKADSFDRVNARRASQAAEPLAVWVTANVQYSQVLERIEPLMTQQANLERNLNAAEQQIVQLTQDMVDVKGKNESLKVQLEATNKEVAELEVSLETIKSTLASASILVVKLQDEFKRWTTQVSELGMTLDTLAVKSILAAAFITYLSDAHENDRVKYVKSWLNLAKIEDFDFCSFMSTEQELLSFKVLGLPSDRLSQENAIIIMQKGDSPAGTSLRPYLIDPSSRATGWLKAYLKKDDIPVVDVSLRDPKFAHELELAVRFGKALIVHEADEIDPILMPLLRGDFVSQGSRDIIQIGDKFIDFNQDFKLYMTTRNPSPILPPASAGVITIVNFTTTRAGLTTQLLSTTLGFEKPELETRKSELLEQTDMMKQDLNNLGTQLLKELASATGNILQNQELLHSLQQTKDKSNEINESLVQKQEVERTLNSEINVYLPLAEFGSLLFFSILDIPKLNRLYKFSLSCFIHLFRKTLGLRSDIKDSTEKRMIYLQRALENLIYEYVCQSLFKGDRLAFALHLTHAMHPTCFQKDEWEVFVGQLNVSAIRVSGIPSWIPDDRQGPVNNLSTHFHNLYHKLNLQNELDWLKFMSVTECEKAFPIGIQDVLSSFQIVLTIQALRPDRLFTAMSDFCKITLDRKSLFPPPTSFREILSDTRSKEPILILVASGADPSQELRELGESVVGIEKYFEISMGKEEPDVVLDKIHEAVQSGQWICLKNLHLVTHWLDSLEKEIQKLEKPHAEFRLWLTSEPHDQFPTILAETCLKIAYESPEGLKKNLQRTYTNWSKEYVVGDRNILRMQSLFVLAFFHAVLQQRRTYIPQGWSKFYQFNESDLRAGAEVLDNMFKSLRGKKIEWSYIRGIFENAIYGGRVDNEYDSRILLSYLENYFNDNILTVNGDKPPKQNVAQGVILPTRESYQDYISLLDKFSDYDPPSILGLPGNIERSWQLTMSNQVITQLKIMARHIIEEGQFVSSVWLNEMSPILNVWKKVNQMNNTTNLLGPPKISDLKLADDLGPLENFVRLEQHNIHEFLRTVHKHLGNISKISRGIMSPNKEMLEIFNSLSKGEAPDVWFKIWEGPQEAKEYITGIVSKVVSIQKWLNLAEQDSLLIEPLNLADLLNPISFMSAFKQYCARKQNLCMDELGFVCFWKRPGGLGSKIPICKLTGLYLEGCTFDGNTLVENTPESPHISKLPDCIIAWVPLINVSDYRNEEAIPIPVYFNESRQKLLTCLNLPIDGSKDNWIQAGVAVFLKSN